MTLREFHLRAYGWKKKDELSWLKVRKIAYTNLIAGGLDPNKLSEKGFMPIGDDVSERSMLSDTLKKLRERNNL